MLRRRYLGLKLSVMPSCKQQQAAASSRHVGVSCCKPAGAAATVRQLLRTWLRCQPQEH
jgi:hypothetical protein